MYSLSGYGEMIADDVRVEAYAQALRRSVKAGSVVLEIGTGVGTFAVLACKLGARVVYAVEPCDVIQVAREVAAANQCAGRIVFFEELSTKIDLPEKADVIVSDLRGILPLFESHIPSIVDARARFLTPGGTLIPRKDNLWAAIAEVPEFYERISGPWDHNCLGQDLVAARNLAVNQTGRFKGRLETDRLVAPAKSWGVLDYRTIENPNAHGELEWAIERNATGHGIIAWFDAELADGVGFSNAPGAPGTIHGSLFFPWPHPVPLLAGQKVSVDLEATLVDEDYCWHWMTRIECCEKVGKVINQFDQSELYGAVLSPEKLRRAASDYAPQLSEAGILDSRILEMMDGRAKLEEIARCLADEFPDKFPRWQDGLSRVAAVSQKYSR